MARYFERSSPTTFEAWVGGYHSLFFLPTPIHITRTTSFSPPRFPLAETITEWSPSQTLRSRPTSAVLSDWRNNFYTLSWIPWEDYDLCLMTYAYQFFDLTQADPESLHPTDA